MTTTSRRDAPPATRPGRSPRIADVAAAAGVSTATVSQVFSGRRPVSGATRARVLDAVERLGYRPSSIARALRSGRSETVALVAQDLTNPFYPALARGLQQSLALEQHALMLFDVAGGPPQPSPVETSIRRQVDGLVLAVDGLGSDVDRLAALGLPWVGVGPEFASGGTAGPDVASADDRAIGADVAIFLLGRGHRDFAVIAGPDGVEPSRGRLDGFAGELARSGAALRPERVIHGDWTVDSGLSAMTTLLRLLPRPRAVFALNDLMALGALRAAAHLDLVVPDDVALVGVDDIDAAALVQPSLTTVHVPAVRIGRCAGELLLSRLDGTAPPEPRLVLVPHLLVTRQSA